MKLYHPDLDVTITVTERAAPIHMRRGWVPAEGESFPIDLTEFVAAQKDYDRWNRNELSAELNRRELDTSGTKKEQVARLRASDAVSAEEVDQANDQADDPTEKEES